MIGSRHFNLGIFNYLRFAQRCLPGPLRDPIPTYVWLRASQTHTAMYTMEFTYAAARICQVAESSKYHHHYYVRFNRKQFRCGLEKTSRSRFLLNHFSKPKPRFLLARFRFARFTFHKACLAGAYFTSKKNQVSTQHLAICPPVCLCTPLAQQRLGRGWVT